jgi:Indolepyruvate ferredoxin oxidoreductase, alpha and beta subunits
MRHLLLGNEAIAYGALSAGVAVATGYPGTPSSEIVETLLEYRDRYVQWASNEKTAVEIAYGAALAGARALAAMKHVGLNVAADPLHSAAYTGVAGGRLGRGGRRPQHVVFAERAGHEVVRPPVLHTPCWSRRTPRRRLGWPGRASSSAKPWSIRSCSAASRG